MKRIIPVLLLIAVAIATTAVYHLLRGGAVPTFRMESPSARPGDDRMVPTRRDAFEAAHGAAETRARLADSLLRSGQAQEAVSLYEQNLREQPDRLSAVIDLAGACAGAGRFDQAAALYRSALRMAPGSRSILIRLARVQVGAGRFNEAIATYRQALEDES